ncbi:MAG: hypothetical protein M3N51_04710, partial [Actinomycetota bacterium]|nr:hypothetical protein [Actinomycetota bacterium]
MEDASAPTSALGRLRQAAEDGRLAEVALQHGLDLIVAFGSTMSGDVGAGDLDLAVRATHHLDPLRLLDD